MTSSNSFNIVYLFSQLGNEANNTRGCENLSKVGDSLNNMLGYPETGHRTDIMCGEEAPSSPLTGRERAARSRAGKNNCVWELRALCMKSCALTLGIWSLRVLAFR